MVRTEQLLVDRVNESVRELRKKLAERSEGKHLDATLPLLSEPDGSHSGRWWAANVEPLKASLERYEEKLDRDDDSHRGLQAELAVAYDLLPEKESR